MSASIIVDTNILFDFYTGNSNFELAKNVLLGKKIFVYQGVLEELFTLLKNRVSSELACLTVESIIDDQDFKVLESSQTQTLRALQIAQMNNAVDQKKNLSLVDAIQIILAKDFGITVMTQEKRMSLFANVENPY